MMYDILLSGWLINCLVFIGMGGDKDALRETWSLLYLVPFIVFPLFVLRYISYWTAGRLIERIKLDIKYWITYGFRNRY